MVGIYQVQLFCRACTFHLRIGEGREGPTSIKSINYTSNQAGLHQNCVASAPSPSTYMNLTLPKTAPKKACMHAWEEASSVVGIFAQTPAESVHYTLTLNSHPSFAVFPRQSTGNEKRDKDGRSRERERVKWRPKKREALGSALPHSWVPLFPAPESINSFGKGSTKGELEEEEEDGKSAGWNFRLQRGNGRNERTNEERGGIL